MSVTQPSESENHENEESTIIRPHRDRKANMVQQIEDDVLIK